MAVENKKRWLTGKEVTEKYGIQAVELGSACYEGKLKAYQSVTCKEYFEETKVAKIPSYYPTGVDPRGHIKRGIKVEWEWVWENVDLGKAFYSGLWKDTFDVYFPDENNIMDYNNLPCLFPFKIEDYNEREMDREIKLLYNEKRSFEHDELIMRLVEKYAQDISNMLFRPADIQACFLNNIDTLVEQLSTGSRKDEGRIAATRQACEAIRQEISQGKCLFSNGKINRKTFFSLVQERLGKTPIHQETVLVEWRKVPDNLKHNGRVSDKLLVQ